MANLDLKALYYPYSRCVNEITLKRAILIFDELWFIDPTTNNMRDILSKDRRDIPKSIIDDWNLIRTSYELLLENKIVHLFDPEQLILENDQLLSGALQADIDDLEVWKICTAPSTPNTWSMLRRKIPPSAFKFLESQHIARLNHGTSYAKAGFHEKYIYPDLQEHIKTYSKDFKSYIKDYDTFEKFMTNAHRYTFHDGKIAYELHGSKLIATQIDDDNYLYQSQSSENSDVEYSCVFPFTHGSSLAVNQALLTAHFLDLIPFTDSIIHYSLLNRKYQRAIDNQTATYEMSLGRQKIHPEKLHRVAMSLFETFIPNELLEQLSIADTVKYRKHSTELYQRLKEYVFELTSQIETEVWDEKFGAEIQKIIYAKIIPESRKIQDEAIGLYESLFGSIAKRAIVAITPALGASILAGLNLPEMLLIGSASTLGSIFPDLMDAYLLKKRKRRNSLSYLLELREKIT